MWGEKEKDDVQKRSWYVSKATITSPGAFSKFAWVTNDRFACIKSDSRMKSSKSKQDLGILSIYISTCGIHEIHKIT